jgi:hypothetical protein
MSFRPTRANPQQPTKFNRFVNLKTVKALASHASGLALIDDSSRLADMRVWLDEKGH